jgi:hypothetical protein
MPAFAACQPSPNCDANHTTCEGREGQSNCTVGHCLPGFENVDPLDNSPCIDIDECLDNATCGVSADTGNECVNTYGSYRCVCKVYVVAGLSVRRYRCGRAALLWRHAHFLKLSAG